MRSTFSEKNEMHISAPKNAATAIIIAVPQFFFRLRGFLISSPPRFSALYYSVGGIMVTDLFYSEPFVTKRLQVNDSFVTYVDSHSGFMYNKVSKGNYI